MNAHENSAKHMACLYVSLALYAILMLHIILYHTISTLGTANTTCLLSTLAFVAVYSRPTIMVLAN